MRKNVIALAALVALAAAGCAGDKETNEKEGATAAQAVENFDATTTLTGMYAYFADAASFVECRTGRRFRVAMEADHAALESAYVSERFVPGEPLLVVVEGRVEKRPGMEGGEDEDNLIVENFREVRPTDACDGPLTDLGLTERVWNVVELNGERVEVEDPSGAPYVELFSEYGKAVGFSGCNRFGGPYEVEGNNLRFVNMKIETNPCPGKKQFDVDLVFMFDDIRRYRIVGETLEFYDDEALRARFEPGDHSGHGH